MSVPPGNPPISPGYVPRPQVRFDAISEALRLLQAQMGTWVVASLLVVLVCLAVGAPFYIWVFAAAFAKAFSGHPEAMRAVGLVPQLVATFVMTIVTAFMTGGMYRMACRQVRGEPISVGDLFTVTDVLPNLLVASVLVGIATQIGIRLCCFPGLIIGGLLMLTIPLVVDRRAGAIEAIGMSFAALKGEVLMASLFYLLYLIINLLGFCACCVGVLFTMPLMILAVSIVYRDFFEGPPGMTYTPPPAQYGQTPPPPPPPPFGPEASPTAPEVQEAAAPHTPPPTVTEPPPTEEPAAPPAGEPEKEQK